MKDLKFAFRMLRRNPLLMYISIPGLAVGLCAILLLTVYLKYELSFDKHFPNNNRVLRLYNSLYSENQSSNLHIALRTAYSQLPQEVPEVEKAVQLYNGWDTKVKTEKGIFKDLHLMYADEEFFDVFGLKLLEGNTSEALSGKKNIVLTKSTAQKLFGTDDCLGKQLTLDDSLLIVSGVIADMPKTTHFKFDMLQPMKSNDFITQQGSLEFITYYLIKESSDLKKAEQNIARVNDELMKTWKARGKLNNVKNQTGTELLRDIHLHTKTDGDMVSKTNPTQLFIVIGIALFIFLIALINFINLYLLYSERRIAEIASRKVVGAKRCNLVGQFFLENGIIAFFALLLGLWLAVMVQPFFARMMRLPLTVGDMFSPLGIIMIALILIILVLIAGAYPGFYLSKIDLVTGLKGKHKNVSHGKLTRSVVLIQFFITILLVCSLIIIRAQIMYMKNIPLGFNADNVVAIQDFSDHAARNTLSIKNELEKLPFVQNVGISQHSMGGGCSGQSIALLNSPNEKPVNEYRVMPGFCETMQLKLKDGRFFSDNQGDKRSIIINEATAQMLGLQFGPDLIISYKGEPALVTGIVKNFYFNGYAGQSIEPLVLSRVNDAGRIIYLRTNSKLNKDKQKQVINIIRKFDPDYIGNFAQLDDLYASKFEKDERIFNMVSSGAYLSILLSFVGMMALSLLNVTRRTKEIGIRKVIGSSEAGIMKKLLGETLLLVGIASILAFSVSYFLMGKWLYQFSTKVSMHPIYFLLSGLFAFFVAFLAVGWQTWYAATRNPVESLRYE